MWLSDCRIKKKKSYSIYGEINIQQVIMGNR